MADESFIDAPADRRIGSLGLVPEILDGEESKPKIRCHLGRTRPSVSHPPFVSMPLDQSDPTSGVGGIGPRKLCDAVFDLLNPTERLWPVIMLRPSAGDRRRGDLEAEPRPPPTLPRSLRLGWARMRKRR